MAIIGGRPHFHSCLDSIPWYFFLSSLGLVVRTRSTSAPGAFKASWIQCLCCAGKKSLFSSGKTHGFLWLFMFIQKSHSEIHKSHINPMFFPCFSQLLSHHFFLGVRGELYGFGPGFWRPRRNTGALDRVTIRWNGPFLKILRNRRIGFFDPCPNTPSNFHELEWHGEIHFAGISWSGNFSGANMGMWPRTIGTWAG